jgi:hypothetical protein
LLCVKSELTRTHKAVDASRSSFGVLQNKSKGASPLRCSAGTTSTRTTTRSNAHAVNFCSSRAQLARNKSQITNLRSSSRAFEDVSGPPWLLERLLGFSGLRRLTAREPRDLRSQIEFKLRVIRAASITRHRIFNVVPGILQVAEIRGS